MGARLTKGLILKIATEFVDDNYKPILQVIYLKQIHTQHGGGGGGTELYRLAMSDGSHIRQAMLAAHLNFLVRQGHLHKGSVVRLDQFTCTAIQGRKFSNAQSPRTRLVDQTTETSTSEPYSLPAMDARLTEGAILNITTADFGDKNYKPILQVIGLKQISIHKQPGCGSQVTKRYRVAISDGSHTEQGMLSSHQNFLVQEGHLQKGSVVRLNEFICTSIQGCKIIIIVLLDVLVDKCDIIGQPARISNAQSLGTRVVDQTTEQSASLGL